MFTSSSLCHVYRHPCSLSEQRPSCVPLVRLNSTAFYIITISTQSVLHTHGAFHAVQCDADSKDLFSQTRLDHRVVMPDILIHCASVQPIRPFSLHSEPLVIFAALVGFGEEVANSWFSESTILWSYKLCGKRTSFHAIFVLII